MVPEEATVGSGINTGLIDSSTRGSLLDSDNILQLKLID